MSTTTAQSSIKLPVYIGYRCSRCGRVHAYSYQKKTSGSASQYGFANKSGREALGTAAQSQAYAFMAVELNEMQKALVTRDFSRAKIPSNRCPDCGATEPWMVPTYKTLKGLGVGGLILLLVLSIVAYGAFFYGGADFDSLSRPVLLMVGFAPGILGYGSIGLLILRAVLRSSAKRKMKGLASSLTDEDLPVIGIQISDFVTRMTMRFGAGCISAAELNSLDE